MPAVNIDAALRMLKREAYRVGTQELRPLAVASAARDFET
jgi:hypothetical protein